MKPYRRVILTAVVTIIAVLVVEVCVALAVMRWGVINVGADHPHPRVVQWYLSETVERSVQEHAKGLKAPAQVSSTEGASRYSRTCALCHGAPEVERSEIGQGLSPAPPDLIRTADDWTVEQVYWIAKHGIGDTGMPAFGPTLGEQELWSIAYFVKQLPNLVQAEYKEPEQSGGRAE